MALKNITDAELSLNHVHNKYTREQKLTAVGVYYSSGSLKKASELSAVPYATVASWKQNASWWPLVLNEIRLDNREEFGGKLRTVMTKAANILIDRLDNGDIKGYKDKVDEETGETIQTEVRMPIGARDAMMIYAISQDKQIMLENQTADESDKETVRDMQKAMIAALTSNFKKLTQARTIEGSTTNERLSAHPETTEENVDVNEGHGDEPTTAD